MALERAFFEDVVRPDSFAVEPSFQAASPLAVEPPPVKTGTAAMPAASETSYVVDRFPTAAPLAQTPAPTPTAAPAPYRGALDFDALSGLSVGTPDFGTYGRSADEYRPAQLMPADPSKGFSTPYYAAYTNSGDLAGAVMVAPGQPIRLVDNKTGQVVFEGSGPEGAAQVVGIANAVSEDRGRKASWTIQADTGNGWQAQAYERNDPKKRGILGTVMDIAAPFVLNALLPGIGGALAGALGSTLGGAAFHGLANVGSGLLQGESLKQAGIGGLTAGALSGLTGAVLDKVPAVGGAVSKITQPVQNVFNTALGPVRAVLDPINDGFVNLIDGAGNIVSTVRGGLDDVRGAIKGGVNDLLGRGAGPTIEGLPSPGYVNFVNTPADLAAALDPFSIEGLTIPGGSTPFGPPLPVTGAELGGAGAPGAVDLEGLTVTAPPPQVPVEGLPVPTPVDFVSTPGDINAPKPATGGGGGVLPGVPTPPQTTGSGKYSISSKAGTRESLSPIFSAQLPAATFGSRTPRDVWLNKRYAIQRPEAAFFSNVQPRGPERFAVPTPQDITMQGVGDVNGDGSVTEDDIAAWRASFRGYAEGGDVSDGRSDDIEARLSDGEYVIDAETVALLGNGSSRAGADALDAFRVNIRKHKGRDLARGKFTADARDPFDYLEAR